MRIVRAILGGIGMLLFTFWVIWIFGWLFSGPENWPAWVNWLSGVSFVVGLIVQFSIMNYYFASAEHGGKQ